MRKYFIYLFGLINLSLIFYFWAANSWHLLSQDRASVDLALGRLSGLLLVSCILLQFLIMSRASALEQTFGLDKLSRLHHFIGKYLVIIFLLCHVLLITIAYASFSDRGFFSQYLGFLKFDDLPKAMIAQWLFIFVIIYSVLMVLKKWNFENWYYAHISVYVAIILAFGHQLELGGDFAESKIFTWYWYLLYAFVALMLAIYRFGKPLWLFYKHRFYIEKIIAETPDVTSVYISGKQIDQFKFQPGQFVIVRFLDKQRRWQAHPFSLSQPFNGKNIRLSIKASGDFTATTYNLQPTTPVLLEGPYGVFTPNKLKNNKALLIAGGIGITPIRGIMEAFGENKKEAMLLYANKTEKDIALREEIEKLGEKYHFPIHHVLSSDKLQVTSDKTLDTNLHHVIPDNPDAASWGDQESTSSIPPSPSSRGSLQESKATETSTTVRESKDPGCHRDDNTTKLANQGSQLVTFHSGFISQELIKELIPDIATYEVFLCGPPPMMAAITKTLVSLGIPKQNIYFEKFSL